MIIVTESDYDYTEIIGVFETLEGVLDYLKEKDLKPQYYEFKSFINETEFKYLNIPNWCYKERCHNDSNLIKIDWHLYCSFHSEEASIKRKQKLFIFKEQEEERKIQTEIDRQKRIAFEKKWDITGAWWADFIHEKNNDEDIKEKVDYWKGGKWMSGSSVVVRTCDEDDLNLSFGEGIRPYKPYTKFTKVDIPKEDE